MVTELRCRFCRSGSGELVLDLGVQPPSEYFPAVDESSDPVFPLRMWWCARCGLAQLGDDDEVPEETTGVEPAALWEQRADAVRWLAEHRLLPAQGRVAEFPSPHGGTFLDLLAGHGLHPAGPTGPADVVVDGCFGVMHAPDQRIAFERRAARVRPGGLLLLQFHSLGAILRHAQWNALRHGHFAYYATPVVCEMLAAVGLSAVAARQFPLYGGTVLLAAMRDAEPGGDAASRYSARDSWTDGLRQVLAEDQAAGVLDVATLRGLGGAVRAATAGLRRLVATERALGHRVFGYGAASRAVSLLYLAGLDSGLLSGVADASVTKQGRRMPGTRIPIISPETLVAERPDVVLVFVSDLMDEVRSAFPQVEAVGGRWVDVGEVR